MPPRRQRRAWHAAAVAGATLAVLAGLLTPFGRTAEARQAHPSVCDGGAVVTRGAWSVLPLPAFADGAGGRQARHHAVAPSRPETIYVTNGTSVQRTTDGGCDWGPVWELPIAPTAAFPFSRDTAQIVDVAIPPGVADRVYLVVMEVGRAGEGLPVAEGATPVIPHVVASLDGGRTFATYDRGLQPIGRDAGDGSSGYCGQLAGCMLEFAPGDPDLGYLALSVSDGAPGVLYLTDSAGQGWQARSVPGDGTDPEPAQGIEQLAIDPVSPTRVWVDSGGLAVSDDAGLSWGAVDDGTDGFRVGLDVALVGGQPQTVVLASGQRTLPAPVDHAAVSLGRTGFEVQAGALGLAGARIDSLDHARDGTELVAAGSDGVFARGDSGTFVRVDEELVASYGPARDVQGVAPVEAFTMLGTGAVLVYHPTEAPAPPPPPPLPPLEIPPPPVPRPISLSPNGAQIAVDPGATATVDYELDLPAQPIPVDVFFLLDTSYTMEPVVEGLAHGLDEIVRRLIGAELDAHFGLAEFQDSTEDTGGVRYRRLEDVARPSQALRDALGAIGTNGGHEPHLTAMDQMATGSGVLDPVRGRPVEPGQDATWRPGSLRIAVLATNEPYGKPPGTDEWCYGDYDNPSGGDPEAPPEETVLQHLRDDDIALVGIEYIFDPRWDNDDPQPDEELCMARRGPGPSPVRVQLDGWADATGARAPQGGIDCDADGNVDLHDGDPLVCSLPRDDASGIVELAEPLVRLILSVRQPRPVEVVASSEGATVSVQADGDYSAVDVRSDQLLGFTAAFSCAVDQAGRQLPVTLTASVAGAEVAQAPATVLCGPQPEEEAPLPQAPQPGVPAPPPPAAPPALAGPPPAPAPVAVGAPAAAQAQAAATGGAAAAAPAAAPGLAPGGAVVDAGPAEKQVRLAHNQADARRERLLLASAYGQEDEHLPIVTWGAAALLFGAAAMATRRSRTRTARIRR